jgi:hypothetical protein
MVVLVRNGAKGEMKKEELIKFIEPMVRFHEEKKT